MTGRAARWMLAALAAADLAVFGGWIALEERARQAQRVQLPVEGYDPRDLLSGHYVRFRLAAEREAEALAGAGGMEEGSADFCLAAGADGRWHVTGRRQEEASGCPTFLRGRVEAGGKTVRFGVERFYVDERRAPQVMQVAAGPDSYLVATLDGEGAVHTVDLVVEGRSVSGR